MSKLNTNHLPDLKMDQLEYQTLPIRKVFQEWKRLSALRLVDKEDEYYQRIKPFLFGAYLSDDIWTQPLTKLNLFGWLDCNRHICRDDLYLTQYESMWLQLMDLYVVLDEKGLFEEDENELLI